MEHGGPPGGGGGGIRLANIERNLSAFIAILRQADSTDSSVAMTDYGLDG
jgi:hypothetical protein